jgi:hypothetical protein
LLHPENPVTVPSLLNVTVTAWVLEITGVPLPSIAPLYVQVPISAGSVRGGGVVATVTGVVDTDVGTGVGVCVIQPAATRATNRTAQAKNSKDFIFTEYHYILYITIPNARTGDI